MDQPSWIDRTLNNRYTIQGLLGQGGMSAVYKANDPNLKRVVAVKLIHSHLATDPSFITRFEEEATAVARLRHPNIVQVFDFNSDGGVYYMVLEFIPGETLQEHLKRLNASGRKMPIDDAIRYTVNICDAMGYAHKQGIIHRDIKPANIMLDVHGQAILMDFGIVKILGGDSHTATGAVVGTARYMSPEVIRAEVPDQRSDVYSLGIALYEMLSGETPFNSDSAMSLMMMHMKEPVPDLRRVRAEIPAALVNVVKKSLEKDAKDRYASAAEMAADLKRVLAELGREPAPKPAGMETVASPSAPDMTLAQQPSKPAGKMDTVAVSAPKAPTTQTSTSISSPRQTPPRPAANNTRLFLLLGAGGVGIFLLVAVVAGFFLLKNLFGSGAIVAAQTNTPESNAPAAATNTFAVVVAPPQQETPTLTPEPIIVPTDTIVPTNTFPALFVQITNITLNGNQYVVEYETYGFTEQLPGMHIHFFFNTVTPEQAGSPGSGPWILYGGPRPFTKYDVGNKPSAATQMCALVANANHSIILESGNCVYLP
ncbi:MAG: protein kinase [Chloroflexi bacterium]|nr:protein kinase [Chloroflexota bacterium]